MSENYEHVHASDFDWQPTDYGAEVARFQYPGMKISVVRGKKGVRVPDHGHSHGSFIYVGSGRINVDNETLFQGEGGACRPGSGFYPTVFEEDSLYVAFRPESDEIQWRDEG